MVRSLWVLGSWEQRFRGRACQRADALRAGPEL